MAKMGLLIYLFGLEKQITESKCVCCGMFAKTSCLPFIWGKRFCQKCALKIMIG